MIRAQTDILHICIGSKKCILVCKLPQTGSEVLKMMIVWLCHISHRFLNDYPEGKRFQHCTIVFPKLQQLLPDVTPYSSSRLSGSFIHVKV